MSQFTAEKMAAGMRLAKKSAARRERELDDEFENHKAELHKRAKREADKEQLTGRDLTTPRVERFDWLQ